MQLLVATTPSQCIALQASKSNQWRSFNLASTPLFLIPANELEQRFVDFLRVTEAQEVLTVLDHLELCVRTIDEERDLLSRVLHAVKSLARTTRIHAIDAAEWELGSKILTCTQHRSSRATT